MDQNPEAHQGTDLASIADSGQKPVLAPHDTAHVRPHETGDRSGSLEYVFHDRCNRLFSFARTL